MHLSLMENDHIVLVLIAFIIALLAIIFAIRFISPFFADLRMAEQHTLQASILESSLDGIFMFKSQGWIIEFNPAAEAMFGYTREEALKRTLFDLLFPFDQDGREAAQLYQRLSQKAKSIMNTRIEIIAYRADRSQFPAEIILTHRVYRGKPVYTAYMRDLTEKMKSEELILQLAYFDHLTGLPNRNQFNERFQDALDYAQQHDETLGVIFLDIYRFKWINDSFGHSVGDQVLKQFSAIISGHLPDNSSASRLSGDEFVILMPLGNRDTMMQQAKKIVTLLETPLQIEDRVIYVSTNIGISIYPYDGDTAALLLKHADQAMYAAKENGRNTSYFFNPAMQTKYAQRLIMEKQLRDSIENNELSLVYQPIFDIQTGDLRGIEALLRWESKLLGSIPTEVFIPLAEETHRIEAIGEWAMRTATKQLKKWHDAGLQGVTISVHVSAVQFHQEHFVQSLVAILDEIDLEPQYVELEMRESIEMNRFRMIEQLHALHHHGFRIAIDDFGTGYSSISYLHKFPFHTLKIDQTFVQSLPNSPSNTSFIAAIIAVARSLQLDIIAEGVETKLQFDYLKSQGCDRVQGYFMAAPLSADQFERHYVTRLRAAGS
jgi:diguanylate cyclase (GGDEF)-like protein/PAS domain S-box-containing protein